MSETTENNGFTPLIITTEIETKNKIVDYLKHCNIEVQETTETEDEVETVTILVREDDLKEATLAAQTVIAYNEKEKEDGPTSTIKKKSRPVAGANVFVDAKERYQEYRSSGIMFLVFGIGIFAFAILNVLHIVTVMASPVSLIVLFGLAIVLFFIGVSSISSSKHLIADIDKEEKSTDEILNFLKETYPVSVLLDMKEEEMTEEALYFKQFETMKKALTEKYPEETEEYIDSLLEDYYNGLEF